MKSYYQYANHIISFDFPESIPLFTLKQHLPSIIHIFPRKDVDISIEFVESEEFSLLFDFNALKISAPWNKNWLIDLPHLIYSYLKYVFFHKGIYFVHSCLIENTLFIGHSGAGKTSLCIEALHQGLSLSSLDRTSVKFENQKLTFLDGTDVLSVRQEEVQPDLSLIVKNGDRNIYECSLNTFTEIKKIKLFQISEQHKEKAIEDLSIVHQLFPFFIDNIKSDCFVQSGKLLFCPVYFELNKKELFKNLAAIDIPVSFISGSIPEILNSIKE